MKNILPLCCATLLSVVGDTFAIERLTPITEPEIKVAKERPQRAAKAWLGVVGHPVDEALAAQLGIEHGVTLELVAPDGSAGKAGIKKFDVITRIGETEIKAMDDLRSVMQGAEVAQTVDVEVFSGGKLKTHQVLLDAHPGNFSKSAKGKVRLRPLQQQPSFSQNQLPHSSLQGIGMSDSERERIEQLMATQLQQMEQQFARMDLQFADLQKMQDAALDAANSGATSSFCSSFTMLDDHGSIKVSSSGDKGKHVTVKDKAGKVLFSGPYETEEDKAAVPEELRERIEALGVGKAQQGFSFSFGK